MKRLQLLVLYGLMCFTATAQTLTDSDLPIIVINTGGQEILNDPKIMVDMGIIDNGAGTRNNITDPFTQYDGKIGIEIRGQSSQMFPMKSYSIELWDAAGESQDKSLFGLPKESDWVLYAPYNDKTLMHNFLAYTLSREMGHWAANCRYVELVIDGDYRGIYVFMEKIKRNSGRVNVPKISSTAIDGDAVTGGYVFSIDKEANGWFSSLPTKPGIDNQSIQFSYVYPKIEDLVTEQRNYIKSYVDSFENVLNGQNFQDPLNGWRRYADESSFIDYFIVNELSRNVDGYRLSTYFYKDKQSKGGKIVAGPVWDYDLSFRNADYCNGSLTYGWAYKFNYTCSFDFWQVPFWWDRFEIDTAFQSDLRCRWKALRQTSLSETHLYFLIDSIVGLTAEARQRHFERWDVLGNYIWPNPQPIPSTYEGEIDLLKSWLSARLEWMDDAISNTGACADYSGPVNTGIVIKFYPDPVPDQLVISIESKNSQAVKLNIYDAMGKRVYGGSYSVATGTNQFNLRTATWNSGMYIVRYEAASGDKGAVKLIKD